VAEGGGLLNRYTLQRRIEGSNPSVSATGLVEFTANQFRNQFPTTDAVNHHGPSPGGQQSPNEFGTNHLRSIDTKLSSQVAPGIFR
jgi:hypothetical protein